MTINGVELTDFLTALLVTGMLRAMPLLLASLGDAFAQRAGLLNLGIEGMMLAGAFFGFWAAEASDSMAAGIIAGMATGALLALLFAWLTVRLRVDQVLVGLAITLFAGGLTAYLYRDHYGSEHPSLRLDPVELSVPLLRDIPVLGELLFEQQLLVYLSWLLVPLFAWLMWRTRFGLHTRAVEESPLAADAAGVDVMRVRTLAMLVAGTMAGLAGAFLTVADLRIFTINVTLGYGFIALAITMLGRWQPWRVAAGALLFGLLASLGDSLQLIGVDIDSEFTGILPYIGIMLALALLACGAQLPAALGVPYVRGNRE